MQEYLFNIWEKIMDKKVSIIIPVYNVKPCYINDAINSALKQTYKNIEIIVVNDGSTKEETLAYLKTIDNPVIKVVNQDNKGLAEARNTGIKNSEGVYILPLDADDVIDKTYVEKAYEVIENISETGIVYCKADFFGTKAGEWKLRDYKFPDILLGNCIFCTALFRKSDWEKVGGYKKEMRYGWEDYEFWLSLIENGAKVYMIPEILFHYRQHEVSMITEVNKEKSSYLWKLIHEFHKDLYEKYGKLLNKQQKNSFIENIFSIKNFAGETPKIITILWIKFKIKRKPKNHA